MNKNVVKHLPVIFIVIIGLIYFAYTSNFIPNIFYTITSNEYEYVFNEDGETICITKYKGIGGNVSIPATIDSYSVTQIGVHAFISCFLKKVEIPDGVTHIWEGAFYGNSYLEKIEIPVSVIYIGEGAFHTINNVTYGDIKRSLMALQYARYDTLPKVIIYGKMGSYAQQYAGKNNIPFQSQ